MTEHRKTITTRKGGSHTKPAPKADKPAPPVTEQEKTDAGEARADRSEG